MTLLWVACSQPERPSDAYVTWHYSACDGCALQLSMTARRHPELLGVEPAVDIPTILNPVVAHAKAKGWWPA